MRTVKASCQLVADAAEDDAVLEHDDLPVIIIGSSVDIGCYEGATTTSNLISISMLQSSAGPGQVVRVDSSGDPQRSEGFVDPPGASEQRGVDTQ